MSSPQTASQRVLQAQVFIPARAAKLWHYLTTASELTQWFCEHAELELGATAGAHPRYDFWGRYTPGNPRRDRVRNDVLANELHKRLRYKWNFLGHPMEVEYTLEPQEQEGVEGCLLTTRQFGVQPWHSGLPSVTDFWLLSLENLRLHQAGVKELPRPDFSVENNTVEVAVLIAVQASEVFKALLSPETLDRWWSKNAVIEPVVGGIYDYGWGESMPPMKILDLAAPSGTGGGLLSISWADAEDPQPTVVTWTLDHSEGGTRVTLVHSGFTSDRPDYRTGWLSFLTTLKAILELGPAWRKVETNGYNVEEVSP